MVLERILGCRHPKAPLTPTEPPPPVSLIEEIEKWEQASLGEQWLRGKVYLVSLALRADAVTNVYAYLFNGCGMSKDRIMIDIPLVDPTSKDELVDEAYYGATWMGEIDPEKYRAYATREFKADELLGFLNREKAGVAADDTVEWFRNKFGLEHQRKYGGVCISSHGGNYDNGFHFNVTIMPAERGWDMAPKTLFGFARAVELSLPHICLSPVSVDAYLEDVQGKLKFLPRDWEI